MRRWLRKKRWDYWAVMTQHHFLFLVAADVDYLGLAAVGLLDLDTGERFEAVTPSPFGLGVRMPEGVTGSIRVARLGLELTMESSQHDVRLRASARSRLEVDLTVERPPAIDTLDVMVPFGGGVSHFTSKQPGLPATGVVRLDGKLLDFGNATACLDFGRGTWPWKTAWNWGCGSGKVGSRSVALNLGSLWTDGTGVTENGLWLDGTLHRIDQRVAFRRTDAGFAVHSGDRRIDLTLVSKRERDVGANLGILAARLDWCVGRWSGTITATDGEHVVVDDLPGWAEELHAKW